MFVKIAALTFSVLILALYAILFLATMQNEFLHTIIIWSTPVVLWEVYGFLKTGKNSI